MKLIKQMQLTGVLLASLISFHATAATLVDLKDASSNVLASFKTIHTAQLTANTTASKNSLRILQQYADHKNGIVHTRYQQLYDGIPVWGHQIITHESAQANLKLNKINGVLVTNIAADLSTQAVNLVLSGKSALTLMLQRYIDQHNGKQNLKFSNQQSKMIYYVDTYQKAHRAYLVSFFVDNQHHSNPARPFYIVDANKKTLLKHWDGLTTTKSPIQAIGPGGNDKIGVYQYGKRYSKLPISYENGICYMENKDVKTVDMLHKTSRFFTTTYTYDCTKGDYYEHEDDSFNGGASPLDDAQYFGTAIENMYQTWYGIKPLSFPLIMRAHYGDEFANAFWDGQQMSFGDGDNNMYPLTSIDIAAHEISHGVTEQNSKLIYSGQSGALNESFSDMAGVTANYFLKGKISWGLGEDILKPGRGFTCNDGTKDALRCLDNPTADNFSIDNVNDYVALVTRATKQAIAIAKRDLPINQPPYYNQDYAEQIKQSIIVHSASGVFNKVFHYIATSNNWGMQKTFKLMLTANLHYWTPDSNFANAAWGVIQAARELHDNESDVVNAFSKVGIRCTATHCSV